MKLRSGSQFFNLILINIFFMLSLFIFLFFLFLLLINQGAILLLLNNRLLHYRFFTLELHKLFHFPSLINKLYKQISGHLNSVGQQMQKSKGKLQQFIMPENNGSMEQLENRIYHDRIDKKMIEILPELQRAEDHPRICRMHQKKIIGICTAPECDNYREICEKCLDGHQHPQHYRSWNEAVEEAKKVLRNGINQLEVTRRRKEADVETHLRHNMALCEIEKSLEVIEELIVQKIRDFKQNIKAIYSQKVNAKISELDNIMLKSYKALEQQLNNIHQNPNQSLAHIYTRDLEYEVKYYDSYFNEIFIHKTRHFKTSLENDRILTLIVTFQQNLTKIFNYNIEKTGNDHRQFHLFRAEEETTRLYTISKDCQRLEVMQLPQISKLGQNLSEKDPYYWKGIPCSIFYKPKNCYYIIGQGRKASKSIVKWDVTKPIEDTFIALRPMETERRDFAVCELGGEIYIVGGENDKEGCLARCQKVVPQYNSQVYIIHSLNTKSSRHSLSTYKDKYILKFGGIKKLCSKTGDLRNLEDIAAPPEIYSVENQQWSIIPIKKELQLKFGIYPSIFKAQNKNMIFVMGGELSEQRLTISMVVQQSKGSIQELKMRMHRSKLHHRGMVIYNSTIRVDDQENMCVFLSSSNYNQPISLAHTKLYNWYN